MQLPQPARPVWVAEATRLARPLLSTLAARRFHTNFNPEGRQPAERVQFAALEALSRLLNGIAPWLQPALETEREEAAQRENLRALALEAIAAVADLDSPDFANWAATGQQPLVDAAFLAQAFLRAPEALWDPLDEVVKSQVLGGIRACRSVLPGFNNWLLFAATNEAFLYRQGQAHDTLRVATALQFHEDWYKGDGCYGDGPSLRMDHYNSFVIQPMLLDVLETFADEARFDRFRAPMCKRAQRYAEIQERMISPDGFFPPLGRSITYRGGAFHHLAYMSWRDDLPETLQPAQVRGALTAVMQRTLTAPGTYAEDGFLNIGLHGKQPSLGESYISRASVYLASCIFLPLGLPPEHSFWSAPDCDWTARALATGADLAADHALSDN
ncbi:MAG: DUF2264 domain-containing protein [Opitutales bacterium]